MASTRAVAIMFDNGIANGLSESNGFFKSEIVTQGLSSMLWEAGSLLGIAAVVYLLAPPGESDSLTTADQDV